MPDYSTPLLDLEVAVARARLSSTVEPVQRADALNNLSVDLSNLGDADSRAEALDCARQAVAIYAWCHAQMPAAFERNLGIAKRTLMRAAEAAGADGEAESAKALAMFQAS